MGIKFGGWAPNHDYKNIGRFKFGGSVRDRQMYVCTCMKYWQILIWQLQKQTTKPPNLIPRQIFWLYGNIIL